MTGDETGTPKKLDPLTKPQLNTIRSVVSAISKAIAGTVCAIWAAAYGAPDRTGFKTKASVDDSKNMIICPWFWKMEDWAQAAALYHELSHMFAGTADHGYYDKGEKNRMYYHIGPPEKRERIIMS